MEQKKRDVIRRATKLFAEKGFNNTSVDEIARESGMAKASFYKYFASKEEVLISSIRLFVSDLEQSIKQLYSQTNLAPRDKQLQLVLVYLERLFEHNIHLLLFQKQDLAVTNTDLLSACGKEMELYLNEWIKESLVDVYGEAIEPFAWDIVFVSRAIAVEYMRIIGPRVSTMDPLPLAEFIVFTIDMMVDSLLRHKDTYVPLWQIPPTERHMQESNPFEIARSIEESFTAMKQAIGQLPIADAEKNETMEVLLQLEAEFAKDKPAKGLLKAYLSFLELREELREECRSLREIFAFAAG